MDFAFSFTDNDSELDEKCKIQKTSKFIALSVH